MKRKQLLLILMICVCFYSQNAFAEMGILDSVFWGMDSMLLGKEAPNFISRTLTRDQQSLNEYRDGKKAIVFFWATWCPYCLKEMTTLSRKTEDLGKKDIKLILVNIGESPQKVGAFLEKNKIEAEVFLDQDTAIAAAYRIVGVPTFFYVNKKGIVNAVENALLDDYEEVLSKEY